MSTDKKTAVAVGVLMLGATASYMTGTGLTDTVLSTPEYLLDVHPNRFQLIVGVLFQFMTCAAVAGIGVLMFPVLKKHSEPAALGYATTRILECALLLVGGIGTLALVALGQETLQAGTAEATYAATLGHLLVVGSHTSYLVAMSVLGLGSLPLCALLYRTRLVPRPLSVLGVIGYGALLTGSLLEIFGFDLNLIHYLPGGLFELLFPLWLIVRGFESSPTIFEPATSVLSQS